MSKKVCQIVLPMITAIIWGTSFAAQSSSAKLIDAFTFNFLRCFVGFISLLIVVQILKKFDKNKVEQTHEENKKAFKHLIWGGFCCGTALALACNLQQIGIAGTSAGKTGFITALYVVLVPICGLFLKKKVPLNVWIGIMFAVAGLYCLCINEDFSIAPSDFIVLLCAFGYTLQILVIDHFVPTTNGVALSCVQFFFCTIWSGIGMLLFEHPVWADILSSMGYILYVGIFSSGVAYTLQIIAQKNSDSPTTVSLILSLESFFGAISGAIFLHEVMSGKEILGCVLMMAAVVLAQITFPVKKKPAV